MAWRQVTMAPPAAATKEELLDDLWELEVEWGTRHRLVGGFTAFLDDNAGPPHASVPEIGLHVTPLATPPQPHVAEIPPALATAVTRLAGKPVLATLGPPAFAADVRHVETTIGARLPADLRAWLSLYDGQPELCEELLDFSNLFSLVTSLAFKRTLDATESPWEADQEIEADPGVRAVWWHKGWFPFAGNYNSGYLCVDLEPPPGGIHGQVVCVIGDTTLRARRARSFTEWLAAAATK